MRIASVVRSGCVFFFGSGFSVDLGMPGTKEIVAKILEGIPPTLQDPALHSKDVSLDVASRTFLQTTKRSKRDLDQIVHDFLLERQEAIQLDAATGTTLKSLPNRGIITTNYDELVEKLVGRESVHTVRRNEEIVSTLGSTKSKLFKIYGRLEEVGDYVLTLKDFEDWSLRESLVANQVKLLLAEYPVLIVGYSGRDSNFQRWLTEIGHSIPAEKLHPVFVVGPVESEVQEILAAAAGRVEYVPGTAKEFLARLDSAYQQLSVRRPQVTQSLTNAEKEQLARKADPFLMYDADNILRSSDVALLFHSESTIMPPVLGPTTVLLSGSRGSGKSMILKYLAAITTTVEGANNLGYVGVYLRWAPPDVEACRRRQGESEDSWKSRFTLYALSLLLQAIIGNVNSPDGSALSIPGGSPVLRECASALRLSETPLTLDELETLVGDRRVEIESMREYTGPAVSFSALYRVAKLLIDSQQGLGPYTRLALLLDEFDRLDGDQRRVLSTLVAAKSPPILVKVSISSSTLANWDEAFFEPYSLLPNHDYLVIDLDDKLLSGGMASSRYKPFAVAVLKKRCEVAGIEKDISYLLPDSMDFPYSGLDSILRLSSGQIRLPIEIIKNIFLKAAQDLPVSSISEPISQKIQQEVVDGHSARLVHDVLSMEQAERAKDVQCLIEALCEYSKLRAQASTQRTLRFIIDDPEHLSKQAEIALGGAVKSGLIQVANPRLPQSLDGRPPRTAYRLHRLLCPRFRLDLDDHHQRTIRAGELDEIFKDKDLFVKNLLSSIRSADGTAQGALAPPLSSEVDDLERI
jgi:hypothetical protein